ncbi:MAG: DUF1194 domain-containing protein [Yoonia sp.]|nr:DUF1194 domain-containing protein [Yoonia sp.]
MVETKTLTGAAFAIFAWALPADACRLALVLAIDVSSSVDEREDRLQRAGLAAALLDPDVQAAFFISPSPVALHVFEWSGRYKQETLVEWVLIRNPEELLTAAAAVGRSLRSQTEFPTAMGSALGHAAIQLLAAPLCASQTIDIAGDGLNNEGFGPREAYAAFPFSGVVVNGLVVNSPSVADPSEIIAFYQSEVIRGPNAFVEIAEGFEDYAAAMRRKLMRELSSQMLGALTMEVDPAG